MEFKEWYNRYTKVNGDPASLSHAWDCASAWNARQPEIDVLKTDLVGMATKFQNTTDMYQEATIRIDALKAEVADWKEKYITGKGFCGDCENGFIAKDNIALKAEVERLNKRDGNATIIVCSEIEGNPFHQTKAKIVDFGVSDNIYMVEVSHV